MPRAAAARGICLSAVLLFQTRRFLIPDLVFVRICNPHVWNIGICNPAILFIALQMLIFHAVGLQIRQNVTRRGVLLFQTRRSCGFAIRTYEYRDLQSRNSFYRITNAYNPCCRIANPTERYQTQRALISEAPRSYFGSASLLFRKRLALILEAPRSYFGSASLLFWKRLALPK